MIRPQLIAQLEALAYEAIDEAQVPGLSVALIDRAGVDWAAGFGVTDNTTNTPVDTHTMFEAASLSKPVVALAVLTLAQLGTLDLDRPLDDYLPAPYLPDDPRARDITARSVLRHTTGLPNWRPRGGPLRLIRDPNTQFGYSGEGFVYLQRAIEHVTHSTLDRLAADHVFEPLGMPDSAFVWREEWSARIAHGHNKAGAPVPKDHPARANAAWSLHTAAADLAAFASAFLAKRTEGSRLPTSAAALAERMLTPHTPLNGTLSWGLGWGLIAAPDGEALFWHWGDNFGFKAFVAGSPSRGLALVVLTNGNAGLETAERLVTEALPPAVGAFDALRDFAKSGYFAAP